MAKEPSGWYADPTRRHAYRYWDGSRWTDQVSDGGTPGVDPVEVDAELSETPPAPGTKAPAPAEPAQQPAQQRPVEVTQSSGGGTGAGVVLGVIIALVLVGAVIYFVFLSDGGDPSTSTTIAPATTVTQAQTTTSG